MVDPLRNNNSSQNGLWNTEVFMLLSAEENRNPWYSAEFSLFPICKEQTEGSGIMFAGVNYPLYSTSIILPKKQAKGHFCKIRLVTNTKGKHSD